MRNTTTKTNATRIGLVGCCKPKLGHAAPARELYLSNLFQLSLAAAERTCDVVYVISAEHGLVELDRVIEPYDKVMADLPKEWRPIWGARVWDALVSRHPTTPRHVAIYAGIEYVKPIRFAAPHGERGATFTEPMARMQIGQRLSWLKTEAARAAIASQATVADFVIGQLELAGVA